MTELHDLLDRATDRIGAPGLGAAVVREAGRRRARRRGAVTAVLASAVVLAVIGGVSLVEPGGRTAPVPTSSDGPSGDVPADARAPRVPLPAAQGPWDPRRVDELEPDDARPVCLPAVVDPPETAPPLADDPAAAAVVAMQDDEGAMLLGTDGRWRSLEVTGEAPRVRLSPEGTRVLVWHWADGPDDRVQVVDVTSGESRDLGYPDGFRGHDFLDWTWVDERTALVTGARGGWRVDTVDGSARPTDEPRASSWALDDDGRVVESTLVDFPGFSRLAAGGGVLAGVSDRHGPNELAVLTVDPGGAVVARLRVRDPDAIYSSFGLGALAVADDGSVLLDVTAAGGRTMDARVVRWRPDTGELSLVSTVVVGPTAGFRAVPIQSWAVDLLRAPTAG